MTSNNSPGALRGASPRLSWLVPLLLASACGGPASDSGTVTIGFPLGKADVTSADYSITGDGLTQAMTGALTLNGDRAEGTVASVPTGSKTVVVKAYTGTAPNQVEVCTGTTTVTVTAGATVPATLLLTCTDQLGDIAVSATFDATRTPDSASATVSGTGIASPIVVPLSLGGGTLTGTIKGVPAGANRSVTVSTTKNGVVECTGMTSVTVTAGATATVSLVGASALTCSSPPPTTGSITINGQVNFTPRIHAVSLSQPGALPGGTVSASVVASDGDGDTLTYAWTLNGAASALFSAATAATTNFTATNLAPGTYTLTATVSDGVTPAVSGSVKLVVGSNLSIGWGTHQFPTSAQTISLGSALTAYARLFVDNGGGPADQGTAAAGEPVGVLAQGGYGPANADPAATPGAFTWTAASYESTCTNGASNPCGNNDEFKAEIKPLTAGTYRYGLRFSTNGGATWTYVDLDSLSNGFQASQLPTLTVN
ncbi:MAG: hypothetical protein FJ086_16015 [Deltaproteobacteria bacterium]|nr:hypothetical protein [Deltaproteobacteria bacterium]